MSQDTFGTGRSILYITTDSHSSSMATKSFMFNSTGSSTTTIDLRLWNITHCITACLSRSISIDMSKTRRKSKISVKAQDRVLAERQYTRMPF